MRQCYQQSPERVAAQVRNPTWKCGEELHLCRPLSRGKGGLMKHPVIPQIDKSGSSLHLIRDWERGGLEKRSGACSVRKSLPKGLDGEVFSLINMERQPISQPLPPSVLAEDDSWWHTVTFRPFILSSHSFIAQSVLTLASLVQEFCCIFNISVKSSATIPCTWKLAFPLVAHFT